MKQDALEEIMYEGIFCDINCASQKINIFGTKEEFDLPKNCTCGGEKRRQQMINSIQQLLDEKEKYIENDYEIGFTDGWRAACNANNNIYDSQDKEMGLIKYKKIFKSKINN